MYQEEEMIYRDCISQFIECYKAQRNLWDPSHEMYFNRRKKSTSYEKLVDILKEVEPKANFQSVRRKINNLRTAYRKETRRMKEARRTDPEYETNLWYFDNLRFLNEMFSENQSSEKSDSEGLDDQPLKYLTKTQEPKIVASQGTKPVQGSKPVEPAQPSVIIDRYDLLGKSIALKVRELPMKQRCLAEKYINEVLFEAELGHLSYSHRLVGPPYQE